MNIVISQLSGKEDNITFFLAVFINLIYIFQVFIDIGKKLTIKGGVLNDLLNGFQGFFRTDYGNMNHKEYLPSKFSSCLELYLEFKTKSIVSLSQSSLILFI